MKFKNPFNKLSSLFSTKSSNKPSSSLLEDDVNREFYIDDEETIFWNWFVKNKFNQMKKFKKIFRLSYNFCNY